jgi:hypothetical protein
MPPSAVLVATRLRAAVPPSRELARGGGTTLPPVGDCCVGNEASLVSPAVFGTPADRYPTECPQ